jgi:hypothetical protein
MPRSDSDNQNENILPRTISTTLILLGTQYYILTVILVSNKWSNFYAFSSKATTAEFPTADLSAVASLGFNSGAGPYGS